MCGFRLGSGGGSGHFNSQFYGRFSKHNQKARQRQVTAFAINSEMQRTNTENRRRRLMELSRLQQSRTSATSLTDVSNEFAIARDSNNNSTSGSGGGAMMADGKRGSLDEDVKTGDARRRHQDEHVMSERQQMNGRFGKTSESSSGGDRRQLDRLAAWEALKTGLQPIPELSSSFDPSSPMISPCVEQRVRKTEIGAEEAILSDSSAEHQVSSKEEEDESDREEEEMKVQKKEFQDDLEKSERKTEIKAEGHDGSDRISIESDGSASQYSGDEFTIRIQLSDGQVSIKSIK